MALDSSFVYTSLYRNPNPISTNTPLLTRLPAVDTLEPAQPT